ncbi:uncharacterized protein LOC112503761 [Cynara cardunculus var. scolymus]|uniref:uncharacterized protein LOC112503761 n=1 Tax=Cynara cardunculus var. scolymus TaxID=59895 RepID=UPI000D6251A3|nr:uncharacterized protein LOC112503761 [Cynara cardunculus var. scolymus]
MSVIEYETEFNRKLQFAQRFVPSEKDKINHFVNDFRWNIHDFVTNRDIPSFAKAVEHARKREHDLSLPDDSDVPEKRSRLNMQQNYNRCGKNHQGRCSDDQTSVQCFYCGEAGHIRTQCPQKEKACYNYGVLDHRMQECPKNRLEQSKGSLQQPMQRPIHTAGASTKKEDVPKPHARAFQITTKEAMNDPDVVTVPLVADKVFRGCTLLLDDYEFLIDLIQTDIRGFDVVIGMDWLAKNQAGQPLFGFPYLGTLCS